jgi:hypothetical protein
MTNSYSEAETRVSSAEKVANRKLNAPTIAPQKYSRLTAEELDKLLWHSILKNPDLYLDKRFLRNP